MGRWFGIKSGKKHNRKSQADPHNETFMTAETEESHEENDFRGQNQPLFPDLNDEAPPTDVLGEVAELKRSDAGFLESWTEFVGDDDANLEGVEASVVRSDSFCGNVDNSLLSNEYADFGFSGLDMSPFVVSNDYSRACPPSMPNTVDFEFNNKGTEFQTGVLPSNQITEKQFFPSFPAFEEAGEIPGFLSADQETKLGRQMQPDASIVRAAPSKAPLNPAASTLQTIASADDDEIRQSADSNDSASHDIVFRRDTSDVSTLGGSRFADADDIDAKEFEVDRFADAENFLEEEAEEEPKDEVPMEPSVEAQIAVSAYSLDGIRSESDNTPSPSSFPDVESSGQTASIALKDSDSKGTTSAGSPLPVGSTPNKGDMKYLFCPEVLDDDNKIVELCASSLSSNTPTEISEASAKTENNCLHHFKTNASPHRWSAFKSGMKRTLTVENTREPPGSYVLDRFEVSFNEAPQKEVPKTSIFDELERRSQAKSSVSDHISAGGPRSTPLYDDVAEVPAQDEASFDCLRHVGEDDVGFEGMMKEEFDDPYADSTDSFSVDSMTQEHTDWNNDQVEENEQNDHFDVAASNEKTAGKDREHFSKPQGSKKSRLVKRALFNLANGGSHLDGKSSRLVLGVQDTVTLISTSFFFFSHTGTDSCNIRLLNTVDKAELPKAVHKVYSTCYCRKKRQAHKRSSQNAGPNYFCCC